MYIGEDFISLFNLCLIFFAYLSKYNMCKLTGRNATTQILLNMALKTHNSNLYVTFQYIKAIANFRKDSEVDFSSDPQSELYADDDYLIFSRGNKHEVCSLHLEASIYRVYIVLSNKMYIKEGYSFFLVY